MPPREPWDRLIDWISEPETIRVKARGALGWCLGRTIQGDNGHSVEGVREIVSLQVALLTIAVALLAYIQKEPEPTFIAGATYVLLSVLPLAMMYWICSAKRRPAKNEQPKEADPMETASDEPAYPFVARLIGWRAQVAGTLLIALVAGSYSLRRLPGQAIVLGSRPYQWKFDKSAGHMVQFKQSFFPKPFSTQVKWHAWLDARTAKAWYIESVIAYHDQATKEPLQPKLDFDNDGKSKRRDIRSGTGYEVKPGIYYIKITLHRIEAETTPSGTDDFFTEDVHFDMQQA